MLAAEGVKGGDRGGGVDDGKAVHAMQLWNTEQRRLGHRRSEIAERRPSATQTND
jgi:hypothetical protein